MPSEMWTWIRNFIRNCLVHTVWGISKSRTRIIRRGVRQGCSISPMLWLEYMAPFISYLWKGIVDDVIFSTHCLADDVCITMSVSSKDLPLKIHLLQKQLDGASEFFRSSSFKLNPSKSDLVVFSTNANIHEKSFKLFILVARTRGKRIKECWVSMSIKGLRILNIAKYGDSEYSLAFVY